MGTTATGFPDLRQSFGIFAVAAVNRSTRVPYGQAEIVGDGSVAFEADSVDNRGGSSLYVRATEITEINGSATFNLREWPDWAYEVFLGANVATIAASATNGTIGTIGNVFGTSVVAATGVIDPTLDAGEEANLKTNYYYVVAVDATTVDVYSSSTFQYKRGTPLFPENAEMKLTASALTILTDTAVAIPGTGLEITGGDGTIAMVAGDVGFFKVDAPHNGKATVTIGASGIVIPEHELVIWGKQRASGEIARIRCFKAQAVSGMTIPFTQSDFASTDITVKLLLDSAVDAVAEIEYTKGIV